MVRLLGALEEKQNKRFQRELVLQTPEKKLVYEGLKRKLKIEFKKSWAEDPTWEFVKIYKSRSHQRGPQCCTRTPARTQTNMAGRRGRK